MTSLTPDIRISDPVSSAALRREIDLRTHPLRVYRNDIADALEQSTTLAGFACPTDDAWARFVVRVVMVLARVVRPS